MHEVLPYTMQVRPTWLVVLCISTLLIPASLAETTQPNTAVLPWDSPQQNDDFLRVLLEKPPADVNIFSHYDATKGIVPDARGNGYDVAVDKPLQFPPADGTVVMSNTDNDKGTMTKSDAAYGNGVYELN